MSRYNFFLNKEHFNFAYKATDALMKSTKITTFWLFFLAHLLTSYESYGQNCDSEADFTFSSSGCVVSFQSNFSGTATHSWQFYRNPDGLYAYSSSNLTNPIHYFKKSDPYTTRLVVHTVTFLNSNGQTVTKTCSKVIPVTCSETCSSIIPSYTITDCLIILNGDGPYTINWGDGTPTEVTNNPVHLYGQTGIYTIQITSQSTTCSFPVSVNCTVSQCCTSNFNASFTRDCAKLILNLDAECKVGSHEWSIQSNCLKYSPLSVQATQNIQITDIDTDVSTAVKITHVYHVPMVKH